MAFFHKHLMINAFVKNPLLSEEQCENWLRSLVELIDMKVLIEPKAKFCNTDGNEGVTGTVVIETSHISMHVWSKTERPYIRMDVYSCKDFGHSAVIDFVDKTMGLDGCSWGVVDRNNEVILTELGGR